MKTQYVTLAAGFAANVAVYRDRVRVRQINNISWYVRVGGLADNDICGWPQSRCNEDNDYDVGGGDDDDVNAAVVT
jgi:hypothetical protein